MKAKIIHRGAGRLVLDGISADIVGGGLLGTPPDIVVPPEDNIQVNNYFELVSLTVSADPVKPFEAVTVAWEIRVTSQNINADDFSFTLFGPDEGSLADIPLVGSATIRPRQTSFLHIKGRRKGAMSPLGTPVIIHVDESECLRVDILKEFIDAVVDERLGLIASSTSRLRIRGNSTVSSEWTTGSITYKLPYELVINNFFDADLDIQLRLEAWLAHGEDSTDLELNLTHDSDADFSLGEDILSLGTSKGVEKVIEGVVPLVLDCPVRQAEGAIFRTFLSYPPIAQALGSGMRLLSLTFDPSPQFEHIKIMLCMPPEDLPENDGLNPVLSDQPGLSGGT